MSLEEYLSDVVFVANEVLDFYTHTVLLLDEKAVSFGRKWHYLGVDPELAAGWRCPRVQGALRALLKAKVPRIGVPTEVAGLGRVRATAMAAALDTGGRTLGILFVSPVEGKTFKPYDAFLLRCVLDVVRSHHSERSQLDLLPTLKFWILQRRHFISATPSLREVVECYLESLVTEPEGRVPFPHPDMSANVRLFDMTERGDISILRFVGGGWGSDAKAWSGAQGRSPHVKALELRAWMRRFMKNPGQDIPDIDCQYCEVFDSIRSHLAVPLWYENSVRGFLSIDSTRERHLPLLLTKALCVFAACATPPLANAQARSVLSRERQYLESVLNAIPDEVLIVDANARIVRMNEAKQTRFRRASVGQYCYKAFELGRDHACEGCYALRALHGGDQFRQALWKYTDPATKRPDYVEISAGRIPGDAESTNQAVEVVRHVGAREAMLKWMADVQKHLLVVHGNRGTERGLSEWLWVQIARGLREMGFARYRLYTYRDGRFYGKLLSPQSAFRGKEFSLFFLDPQTDLPSWISLQDERARPVRFVVNNRLKHDYEEREEEMEWNYRTCSIKRVPPKCVRRLSKAGIKSWMDVVLGVPGPIAGAPGLVFGKVSVDRGPGADREDTAYDMALLASFGRFASVALHVAEQHAELVKQDAQRVSIAYACKLAHELNTIKSALKTNTDYLAERLPTVLEHAVHLSRIVPDNDIRAQVDAIQKILCDGAVVLASLDRPQIRRADELVAMLAKLGIGTNREELTPLVLADLAGPVEALVRSGSRDVLSCAVRYLIEVSNVISRVHTSRNYHDTMAQIHRSLTAESMLSVPDTDLIDVEESVRSAISIVSTAHPGAADIRLRRTGHIPRVPSYAQSLRLVWINLLKNAIEATQEAAPVDVLLRKGSACVICLIKDRGRGLKSDIIRFISTKNERTRHLANRYQGLTIVKGIVAAHKGKFEVLDSGPSGTIVSVKIPTTWGKDDEKTHVGAGR